MKGQMSDDAHTHVPFPDTRWHVVNVLKGDADTPEARKALASLCGEYWYPLYSFARREGFPPEDAEDVTQSFFAKILRNNFFAAAMPEKGRLRKFLLGAFRNHMKDGTRVRVAEKRGGGLETVPLDFQVGETQFQHEAVDERTPDFHFDRNWAGVVTRTAFANLVKGESSVKRREQFAVLRKFIFGKDEDTPAAAAAAEKLGMTPVAMRAAVVRLRQKLRTCVKIQVARTLRDPDAAQVEEELETLLTVLRRS